MALLYTQTGLHTHARVLRVELNRIRVDSTAGQHIQTYVRKQAKQQQSQQVSIHTQWNGKDPCATWHPKTQKATFVESIWMVKQLLATKLYPLRRGLCVRVLVSSLTGLNVVFKKKHSFLSVSRMSLKWERLQLIEFHSLRRKIKFTRVEDSGRTGGGTQQVTKGLRIIVK